MCILFGLGEMKRIVLSHEMYILYCQNVKALPHSGYLNGIELWPQEEHKAIC
jgi:hypothetical protein